MGGREGRKGEERRKNTVNRRREKEGKIQKKRHYRLVKAAVGKNNNFLSYLLKLSLYSDSGT